MPVEILGQISSDNYTNVRHYLDEHYLQGGLLTPDVSNYAKGRQRCWLQLEWSLRERSFSAGHIDDRLWQWCQKIWPDAKVGLVTYGPVGITAHRDDSYADYDARVINLGDIQGWGYHPHRDGYGAGPQNAKDQIILQPPPGAILRFNCKDPHWVINPAEDRWAISLWRIADKYLKHYQWAQSEFLHK